MRHATQSARADGEAITHHNVVGDGKRRLEVETKICICAEMEKLFDEVRFLIKWGSSVSVCQSRVNQIILTDGVV